MSESLIKVPSYRIPGYRIEREVGRGGMATVYLALQESLHRKVALKVMNPALSADEDFRLRFLNEGHIVGQLSHSSIVTVFDIGSHDNHYYLSMEYLPGGSLRERVRGGLSLEQALDIAATLGSALGYAHQRGFIHRDIKPLNVLFREDGTPVLTDFGIAKAVNASANLTRTGYAFGSVGYMSPEQALGKPIDHRADIYSFGVMFWEMLTGKRPYDASDAFSLALKHATAPLPELPDELRRFQPLLDKLLAKQPDDRYDRAEDFVDELDRLRRGETVDMPRTGQADPRDDDATVVRPTSSGASPAPTPRSTGGGGLRIGLVTVVVLAIGVGAVLLISGLNPFGGAPSTPDRVARTPEDDTRTTPDTEPETATIDPTPIESSPQPEPTPADTETRVARLLTRADLQWSEGRFTEPPGDNAFATYQQVLELDPDNSQASERLVAIGRRQLSMQYQQKARELLEQGELDRSLTELDQGLRLAPGDPDLLDLKRQVEERILVLETTDAPPAEEPPPESVDMDDPQALLARAREQWNAGRHVEPPGDNAYETYQRVLELQPDNNAARSGLLAIGRIRLGNQYQNRAEQLRQDGALQDSLAEVEQGLRLAPEHPGLLALREQLVEQLDGNAR